MTNEIIEIIKNAVLELNQFRSEGEQLVYSENLVLFGSGALIDSLDLVSVITEIEEALSDNFQIEVSLTDDRALSRMPSPYDSVGLLVEFVNEVVSDSRSD